ncbi:hypothetical protein ES332_D01G021100v1 [Gossypium tomentosum]|uniref:Uncharacterized protein n=1 Tax=Gossypium tomentosum TaxID=34277 RepID=A0A5D2M4C3_GOSTO|nr:hypothetical protein ES332_D01G021100v1 [Gossypium tomentosum]
MTLLYTGCAVQYTCKSNGYCNVYHCLTSAEFHPTHCNMLAYSSSKGSIRLIDLRQLVLCDSHAKLQVFYRF